MGKLEFKSLSPTDLQNRRTDKLLSQNYQELIIFTDRYLKKYYKLDEDSHQEFLIKIIPYLNRKVVKLRLQNKNQFIPFWCMVLKKRIISFLKERYKINSFWEISRENFCHEFLNKTETESKIQIPWLEIARALGLNPNYEKPKRSAKLRFLIWAFRQLPYLSEFDVEWIAALSKLSVNYIRQKFFQLKKFMTPFENRFRNLAERRNHLFIQLRVLEQNLKLENDPSNKNNILAKYKQKHQAFLNLIYKLSRCRKLVSHLLLAKVFNLPRGTVNSLLSRAKNLLESYFVKRPDKSA